MVHQYEYSRGNGSLQGVNHGICLIPYRGGKAGRRGKDMAALRSRAEEAFNRELGVESEIEMVPPGTIERAIFKAQRIIKTFS